MTLKEQTPQTGPGHEGQQKNLAGDGSFISDFQDQVKRIIEAHCLCLPASSKTKYCDGITWGNYKQPITLDQFNTLGNGFDGCCIITGKRSGNLEVKDFDPKIDQQAFNEILKQ